MSGEIPSPHQELENLKNNFGKQPSSIQREAVNQSGLQDLELSYVGRLDATHMPEEGPWTAVGGLSVDSNDRAVEGSMSVILHPDADAGSSQVRSRYNLNGEEDVTIARFGEGDTYSGRLTGERAERARELVGRRAAALASLANRATEEIIQTEIMSDHAEKLVTEARERIESDIAKLEDIFKGKPVPGYIGASDFHVERINTENGKVDVEEAALDLYELNSEDPEASYWVLSRTLPDDFGMTQSLYGEDLKPRPKGSPRIGHNSARNQASVLDASANISKRLQAMCEASPELGVDLLEATKELLLAIGISRIVDGASIRNTTKETRDKVIVQLAESVRSARTKRDEALMKLITNMRSRKAANKVYNEQNSTPVEPDKINEDTSEAA